MATREVTISMTRGQLGRIEEIVATGQAASISGFVQAAVRTALDDAAAWGALLAQALEESGGPLSPDEQAWADAVLTGSPLPDRAATGART